MAWSQSRGLLYTSPPGLNETDEPTQTNEPTRTDDAEPADDRATPVLADD